MATYNNCRMLLKQCNRWKTRKDICQTTSSVIHQLHSSIFLNLTNISHYKLLVIPDRVRSQQNPWVNWIESKLNHGLFYFLWIQPFIKRGRLWFSFLSKVTKIQLCLKILLLSFATNTNNLVNHKKPTLVFPEVFTLQRHSPVVLLQSLWNPLLVSQLQGPHTGLPHQPWGHGFSTLPSKTRTYWIRLGTRAF